MKLKRYTLLPGRTYFWLHLDGAPRPFVLDLTVLRAVVRVAWRYQPDQQKARARFSRTTRQYLHRYVLFLHKRHYPEVTFANGNPFDCRLHNLKPYRRCEEGAQRCLFKNSTSQLKGVCWHKGKRRWAAMLRHRGKLKHLGYFNTAETAAAAYARAWRAAHPTLAGTLTTVVER